MYSIKKITTIRGPFESIHLFFVHAYQVIGGYCYKNKIIIDRFTYHDFLKLE